MTSMLKSENFGWKKSPTGATLKAPSLFHGRDIKKRTL